MTDLVAFRKKLQTILEGNPSGNDYNWYEIGWMHTGAFRKAIKLIQDQGYSVRVEEHKNTPAAGISRFNVFAKDYVHQALKKFIRDRLS